MNHISIALEAKSVLIQLVNTLYQLTYEEYTQKMGLLSHSSIGEHTRHIIELFQQLLSGYETGTVDYDKRKRNLEIQQNIDYAVECIADVVRNLEKSNKTLSLNSVHSDSETVIESNYIRELMYNLEHCIHHQAIIKIGFSVLGKQDIDENFGVAKSTILYRAICAP